ncbi:hypothetical protein DL96DRAFT_1583668 [Flagelloscypha sp. PMI_526]|nr:hypothetical protein DL96DRAFT_1583668 [Flagelloscypha sp. PMI_526]
MNSAFFIPEIFSVICEYVDASTLVQLACTASHLREAALDELYGQEMTMPNLVRCLPSVLLVKKESEDNNWLEWTFLRDIVKEDIPDAMKYFSRVKNLYISGHAQIYWRPILTGLAGQGVNCFFPNLRTIRIQVEDDLFITNPTLFFGGLLQHVVLDIHDGVLSSVWMKAMKELCPYLQTITFCGDFKNAETEADALASLHSWKHLTSVKVHGTLTAATFQALASVTSLEVLRSQIEAKDLSNPQLIPIPDWGFSSLQELNFPGNLSPKTVSSSSTITSFQSLRSMQTSICSRSLSDSILQAASRSPLKSIDLRIQMCTPDALQTIAVHFVAWSTTLEDIYMSETGYRAFHNEEDPTAWRFHEMLSHLACLRQLRRLRILVGPGFTMREDDVDTIGGNWKHLEVIQLYLPLNSDVYTGLSLEGFTRLASECPALTTAIIPFSWLDVPPLPSGPQNLALSSMSIGRAPIEDASAVAAFLECAFPNLKKILPDSYIRPPYGERWNTVKSLVANWD